MDDNGQTFLGFLIGFIVGGLVGAMVALLYAPQSGEETRATIREKSIELKDQASVQATNLRDQAQRQIASLQQQITDLQARMQQGTPAGSPPEATPPAASSTGL
jgi:gas vesicle protein